MQTIINITDTYTDSDNLIFVVTDVKSIQKELFSEAEMDYIKTFRKDHKQDTFLFNRLNNWQFIIFVDKDKNTNQRLENFRVAGAKFNSVVNQHKINNVVIVDTEEKPSEALSFAEGLALSNYQFLKYKSDKTENLNSLNSILLFSTNISQEDIDNCNIIVDATSKCRDMVNEPVAYMNAVKFAEEIELMGQESGIKVEVLNKKKIESLKMGGLLAVNKGSVDPPTFTIMEYKPENPINDKPYVFVGKGVVYDTGGMNIKTGCSMNDMKCDMAGGATIATAIYAIARAKLPVHIIGLVPATDNRTHGNAYVNGDIITMFDGTKVEVINTDAEGRMLVSRCFELCQKI